MKEIGELLKKIVNYFLWTFLLQIGNLNLFLVKPMAKLLLGAVRLALRLERLKEYGIPSHCKMYCLYSKSDRNCLKVKMCVYIYINKYIYYVCVCVCARARVYLLYAVHTKIMKSENKVFIFCT